MDDLDIAFIPAAINPRRCVMESTDESRREAAIMRIKAKNDFKIHLFIYGAINAMLVVVWAVTRGYVWFFWPIFSIVGWGVGVFANWYEVYRGTINEDQIQREMKKLR
jgi:hypothetical protein